MKSSRGAGKDGAWPEGPFGSKTSGGRVDVVWERPGRRAGTGPGCKAGPGTRGGAVGAAGGTCFRGSCRGSSGCWAAARVSAPLQSQLPRCSPVPSHPHPATPAKTAASLRSPSGPVSPPNRSPAAVQSSVSAGSPGSPASRSQVPLASGASAGLLPPGRGLLSSPSLKSCPCLLNSLFPPVT